MSQAEEQRRTNGQGPNGVQARHMRKPESQGNKDTAYVGEIVDTEIDEKFEKYLRSEFSDDYPLAKFPHGHAEREELLLQNRMDMFIGSFPPPESEMTGEARETFYGDRKTPLDVLDYMKLQSYMRRILSRISRGEGGWQQDKFDGVLSINRNKSDQQTGGFFSKLFG